MILAEPVLKEQPGATIIADVKASQTLFDRVGELGGSPLMWKTGHSLIKSKMKETGAPLAGEMSGHIFFKHRWYGFDDALYAAVRLIEAVSQSGRTLTELKDAMPTAVATPELRFQVDEVPQVRHRRGSPRSPLLRRSQGRRNRRRPRQHSRRLVAASGFEHAGRARRSRRSGRPIGTRPAGRADRQPAGEITASSAWRLSTEVKRQLPVNNTVMRASTSADNAKAAIAQRPPMTAPRRASRENHVASTPR